MSLSYSKFDNLSDSEEEEEKRRRTRESFRREEQEILRADQEAIERWLKRQEENIRRNDEKPRRPNKYEPRKGREFGEELEMKQRVLPIRKLTKDERKVVAMLVSVSHFEEGQTNLERHPQILELVRHNRWLEEDPGTLELLCRAHNFSMRIGTNMKKGRRGVDSDDEIRVEDTEEESRIRAMIFCGINTLAAPKYAKCEGGVLELMNTICTPETTAARDLRIKWQKKEYAKDAIMRSLFPEFDEHDPKKMDDDKWIVWMFILIVVLVVFGIIAVVIYADRHMKPSQETIKSVLGMTGAAINGSNATVTAVANTTATASTTLAAAAAAASGAAATAAATAGGGVALEESQRKIEELQRQIEELKRAQAAPPQPNSEL